MKWVNAKKPDCMIVTATKAIVDDLLARNVDNRNVRLRHVEYLHRAIERDEWVVTNQGIGIDTQGNVIDGQHRLLALKEAGYPEVPLLIVFGLAPEAKRAIDIGITRTILDFMHLHFDHPESTLKMVATVRLWGLFSMGKPTNYKPTPTEMAEWYELLLPALELVFAVPNANGCPGGSAVLAAVCQRVISVKSDQQTPLDFLEGVTTGVGLEKNSPQLTLRNWLAAHKSVSGLLANRERYERTATALVAYIEGRAISRLYRRKEASNLLDRAHGSSRVERRRATG